MKQVIRLETKPGIVRQGDVLLIPIENIDESDIGELIQENNSNQVVLALGEATGHQHAFYPDLDAKEIPEPVKPPRLYALKNEKKYGLPGTRLLRLETRAYLRHEEHDPISIAPGDKLVIPQHEGDELQEIRRVTD